MITLRDIKHSDDRLLVAYLNDLRVTKYLSSKIPVPYRLSDAHWWIETGSKQDAYAKVIECHGKFCGVIGLYTQALEYAHSAEIGYWIAYEYWGRGVATEAVLLFSESIFSTTDITRLFNPVTASKLASRRVMEKSGYALEGTMRNAIFRDGKYDDECMYARLKG